jgi:hypothetical protein
MKKLIDALKIYFLIVRNPDIFKVTAEIFKTLEHVAYDGMPRTQSIIIDFKSQHVKNAKLNLWVCEGEGNPIERIEELRKEIDRLITS